MSDCLARDIGLNRAAAFQLKRFGHDGHPVLVVDQLLSDPDSLVESAAKASYVSPRTYYPGVQAPLPVGYIPAVVGALRPFLTKVFGLSPQAHLDHFGFFALATTRREELNLVQTVPHIDTTEPSRLAFLHYLSRKAYGGTAFFRHRATGFEAVTPQRQQAYEHQVKTELAARSDETPTYAGPESRDYEQTGAVEGVFNRLIVYRSNCLHSAVLDGSSLSTDPRSGRLTANSFIGIAGTRI